MQRIFVLIGVLFLGACGNGQNEPSACIYSAADDIHSCFQKISGNNSDFLSACEKVLIFNRLKYKEMMLNADDACPSSPSATCRNVLDNTADLNFYDLSSEEEIATQGRACKSVKGIFIVHSLAPT